MSSLTDATVQTFEADVDWADAYRLFCQRVYLATYTRPDLGVPAELFSVEAFSTPQTIDYFNSLFEGSVRLMTDQDQKVVGGVAVTKTDNGYCMMKGLYIDPAFQGKGYGTRLFELVREFADDMPIQIDVIQYMTRTLELYKHWGFEVTDAPLVSYPLSDWPKAALEVYRGVTMVRQGEIE
jgi:GNAT superfamily N-acetyltransferase